MTIQIIKHNNIHEYNDTKYHFMEFFNKKTGTYIRSGIIENDKDTDKDPFMRSFPSLLDIGIMGGCKTASQKLCQAGGMISGCYQGGRCYNPNKDMKFKDYCRIIDEGAKNGLMQVALGGAGNPNDHIQFTDICRYTYEKDIIPNYTTAGIELTDEMVATTKKYCGAVAVSWYRSDFSLSAINKFIEAGCKTNIHFVISNETIDEAINLLQNNYLTYKDKKYNLDKLNAIIFLLYKPVGLGKHKKMLTIKKDLNKIKTFYSLASSKHPFKIGFDSCNVPAILNFTTNINYDSIDTCEGGRFSAYISPDLIMVPCSFDQNKKYGIDLHNCTINDAWNSSQFNEFRNKMTCKNKSCSKSNLCLGGCPLIPSIVLCPKKNE